MRPDEDSTEAGEPDPSDSASAVSAPGLGNSSPASSATDTTSSLGVIEPKTPVVLARDLVFGARLCLGSNNQLYYPNRVGYPLTEGLEELWVMSRSGGDARVLATPGSVTGCAQFGDEVWTSKNNGNTIARIDANTGATRELFETTGTPLQVASNSTRVFASVSVASSTEILSIDPTAATPPQQLWAKNGSTVALWLRAYDDRLVFTAKNFDTLEAWIGHVRLSPYALTEVTTTGEAGGVDVKGDFLYYSHYTNNEVRRIDLTTGADTVLAALTEPWGLVVDGDHVYVATRPDYCTGTEGRLYRVPTNGGNVTLLADNLNCPSQLVSDESGLYWINTGSWAGPSADPAQPAPADGSIMYLPRP